MYVKNDKPILILLIYFLFFCFATNPFFTLVVPKIVNYNLNLSATYFGAFQAFLSAGAITGMLIVGYLSKKNVNQYVWFISSVAIISFIIFLFAIPILPVIQQHISNYQVIIIYCIMVFVLELVASTFVIPMWVIFQKRIPNEYRGRFFAIFNTCVLAATPIGKLVFGSLSDIVPMYLVVFFLGLFMLTACFLLLFFPKLKELY
jgi:MFS transporter, DHA3 family, macrolide efflux protein